jgi:hypothetical protein
MSPEFSYYRMTVHLRPVPELRHQRGSSTNLQKPRLAAAVAAAIFVLASVPAGAQHPLCPAPAPGETYYIYCPNRAQAFVESFLYDFTVSQLFKSSDPIELPVAKVVEALGLDKLLFPTDQQRLAMTEARPTVEFRPLDRHDDEMNGKGYSSSGEFVSKSATGPQTLQSTDPLTGATVTIELPETIQGLYWRSPSHLELKFYAGHGVRFAIGAPGSAEFKDAVQCISVSRSEVRATTGSADNRSLLGRFGGCK